MESINDCSPQLYTKNIFLYIVSGGTFMRDFTIWLHSVQEVQEFVGLATTMGFPVQVNDGHHKVDGDSFMEMFCLNCTQPLTVTCQCDDAQLEAFRAASKRFLAE